MIKVRYIYSACVVTETPDVHILHDPWFTDGVYDGAWYQFPKLDDPMACIGNVDLIYVSHIHPDHYDPIFLQDYFEKYGEKKIIIGDHKPNHLMNKMKADGFSQEVLDGPLSIGATSVTVLAHKTGSVSDIDTAIVIQFQTSARTHTVVNCNDVIMDQSFRDQIKETAGNDIDVCLLGYTGAGPYPQTYYEADDAVLKVKSEAKKQEFFARYTESIGDLQAKKNLPFAGQYLLGGRLAHMNPYRGVADACEVLPLDPKRWCLRRGWMDRYGWFGSSCRKNVAL